MKKVLSLFAFTCMTLSIFLTSCKKDEDEALPSPVLENFNPTTGIAGTNVIITGTNFSTTPSKNEVKFNGTVAVVSAATKTQLTVAVPADATSGPISIKTNGKTIISAIQFFIPGTPLITSVEPNTGIPGAQVIIDGNGFGSETADNVVKFNGVTATIQSVTTTRLTVFVPATATTGKITVTAHGMTATSPADFTVIQPPTITSFAPVAGARGANVIITGTNFNPTPATNSVRINNVFATITAASTTQLTFTVPATATTGKISVFANGVTVESTTDFTVQLVPVITAFTPASAKAGTQVTIDGTNFITTSRVYFNGVESPHYIIIPPGRIAATVPNTATTGKISIVNGTLTGFSDNDFVVSDAFNPMAAMGGPLRSNTRVAFVIDGKGYTGASGQEGGVGPNYAGFWEYNPTDNVWTQKAQFAGTARNSATGFAVGLKGYVVTGHSTQSLKDCWEYNSVNNTWTKKNDFAGEARSGAAAFAIGQKAYVGMGVNSNGNSIVDFWEYNPVTDNWTQINNVPAALTPKEYGTSFAIGNKGYIGGGQATATGRDFWEYDPATGDWAQKRDLPDKSATGSFVIGTKAFVSIFSTGAGRLWQYDAVLDTWGIKLNGQSPGFYSEGFAIGNYGYMRLNSGGQAILRYTP